MSGPNWVTLSNDRMQMVISNDAGQQATLQSSLPDGFTPAQVEHAREFPLSSRMMLGQVNRARRIRFGRRSVYVHVNTGPPTWWWPRIEVRSGKAMLGWLRGLIAVSWQYSDRTTGSTPTEEQP